MDRDSLIEEIRGIIQDFLAGKALDLVELIYRFAGRDLILRILVDKPEGGITLQDCAYVNNEISRILDEKDIIQERYILEVSSPGIGRPLKTKADFLRSINKEVKIFLNEPLNSKLEWEGIIVKVDNGAVCLDILGEAIEIPLSKITKAKQVL